MVVDKVQYGTVRTDLPSCSVFSWIASRYSTVWLGSSRAAYRMERDHSLAHQGFAESATALSRDLIHQILADIFQSAPFRASKQSQHLLGYIVDQTLSGHSELLKERLIGVNVFGRRPDYDTNEDPIVRARAAEVRKRLAQFYIGEGNRSLLRIEIAPGSYLASFVGMPQSHVPVQPGFDPCREPPGQQTPAETGEVPRTKRFAWSVSLAVLPLICLIGVLWFTVRPVSPIDQFWKPFAESPNPVILYSGANAVYMLSSDFMDRYKATHHLDALQSAGREFVVPISSDVRLGPNDLVAFTNDFITIGDLSANVRVASLLATHRKRFDLRCGEDVAFSDLRQSSAILIGAFNNSWTMELTGDLPYTFQHAERMTIRDQSHRGQSWSPTFGSDAKVSIDYAIVTRMPHSKTGQPLIAIAGITQAGTHAAADLITDAEQLKKLAASLPEDWAQRNLQFVLQTKVVKNIPTSPTIVAFKYW